MPGYYRSPTIHQQTVVFASEDDLWSVPAKGGTARRLTASLGATAMPHFSPDGQWLAFTAREEGYWEVYLMPATGGEARRLTFQGALAEVVGWEPDGRHIVFASDHASPFAKARWLFRVSIEGGMPERLPYGVASRITFGPRGAKVIGRHASDPARWKRYRGGTAGQLWIDRAGDGTFERFKPSDGNITAPLWIGRRIYFISDHEGIGNLYSCGIDGKGLRRHTHHDEYYVRNATTDGTGIVYHAGGDLYVHDVKSDTSRKVNVRIHSPRAQRQRKYVDPGRYLQEYSLHPEGLKLAVTTRGKLFSLGNWEGPALQHGEPQGVRYRLPEWLNDGTRIVTISDADGEEALEVHALDATTPPVRFDGLDIGRATGLYVSPTHDVVAIRNHRLELLLVDLESGELKRLDHSEYGPINGVAWSPDGHWLAYSFATNPRTRSIKICDVATGESHLVTDAEFSDVGPAWDPEGRYLYFLSFRTFNPVYDAIHFELGFPRAMRPMLVTLQADTPNPFVPRARRVKEEKKKEEKPAAKNAQDEADAAADADDSNAQANGAEAAGEEQADDEPKGEDRIRIDIDGIQRRIVAFPGVESRFGQIAGLPGKALFTCFPVEGSLRSRWEQADSSRGALIAYDFKQFREETLVSGLVNFEISRDGSALAYSTGKRLRVIKAGEKPREEKDKGQVRDNGRSSGWIDMDRLRVAVEPALEWRQMYREAWRLQREHFWTQDMSGVDWQRVYTRYYPLLERIGSRSEFSDLMWEMQGELGTSHAYEMGGDYRLAPYHPQGHLGADFAYDETREGYRITHIVQGDCWEPDQDSPLHGAGVDVREGDLLLAINNTRLSRTMTPKRALVHLAGQEVELTLARGDAAPLRVIVKTMYHEHDARYREWVARNRRLVHEQSKGMAGYIHVPNMMAWGYAEFHRGWLSELQYPGLVIDVRYNGGGHVSQLLLEKLARRRLGYDVVRWGPPIPYPYESALGPLVCVTNENAGSDGDMFSHAFKLMKLGPLVGTRTWGGVVGITRNQTLVDGGLTTQPEYAIWFEDVGWNIENYGAVPDHEVEITPQDYAARRDPQLAKSVALLMRQMKKNPPRVPDFDQRPNRGLPTLPGAGRTGRSGKPKGRK